MTEPPYWILVLEDDPVQSAVYEKILKAGRYQVTAVPDPVDFVANLDTLPIPTAVLLDIVLPGMDGVTVLQNLERHPRWCMVPVILMTASPTRDRVLAAQKLPVPPEGFLVKPVDPKSMLQTVRSLIECRDPIYMLRGLQRKRLGLKASLSDDVVEIEMSLRATDDERNECASRLAEMRKEMQALHLMQGQFRDSLNDSRLGVRERIQDLETAIERVRRRLDESETTRRRILRKRQDILLKQRAIRESERQIHSLATILRRGKPVQLPSPGSPDEPASSEEWPGSAAGLEPSGCGAEPEQAAEADLNTGTDPV